MRSITPRRVLSREQQTEITRIIVKVGQMLAQFGAESRIIEQTTVRLGMALGLESVEMAISSSAIVLTSLYQGGCVTTTRRVREHGINMQVVCEIQRICIMAEKELIGAREVRQRLEAIVPFHYHPWLVVPMVGLSCGAFSLLFGGDWPIFLVTCCSAAVAMRVRQLIARHHHSPLINFAVTGFIATLLASSATFFNWGAQPYLAMAASVLLLVPGFPLINAVSDMVKGYFNMGLARWGSATLLTISAAIGIILAMSLTGIWGVESMTDLLWLLAKDAFWSSIPAVGFAMLFNVPPRMLKYCAMGGALAHSLRTLLIHYGMPIEWATLAAATTVGFVCVYWSRRLLAPRPVFSVASIIPMIPGSYAFKTMIAVVELNINGVTMDLLQSAVENGLKALFIVGALSFGLAIPSLVVYRNRPII